MSETAVFYIFSALAVFGAAMVVCHRNPVTSAVSLVLTLFSTAALFVLLHAHFVAAVQILVYAGAIMVLFLFTVMFLNIRESELRFDGGNAAGRAAVLFLVVAAAGFFASRLFSGYAQAPPKLADPENFGGAAETGRALFGDYLLAFELTSVLVVAAMVGVLAIAGGKRT